MTRRRTRTMRRTTSGRLEPSSPSTPVTASSTSRSVDVPATRPSSRAVSSASKARFGPSAASSFVAKYRKKVRCDMPTRAAMPSTVVPSNPRCSNRSSAASSISDSVASRRRSRRSLMSVTDMTLASAYLSVTDVIEVRRWRAAGWDVGRRSPWPNSFWRTGTPATGRVQARSRSTEADLEQAELSCSEPDRCAAKPSRLVCSRKLGEHVRDGGEVVEGGEAARSCTGAPGGPSG